MGEEPGSMTPRIRGEEEQASAAGDPAQIRAEIVQTRAEMSETIDAIQEKLSPQRLMEEAKDTVRDATVGKVKDMMSSATDKAADLAEDVQDGAREAVVYVKQNPIPAVMIGAGIAWLLLRPSTRQSGSSVLARTHLRRRGVACGLWRRPLRRAGPTTVGIPEHRISGDGPGRHRASSARLAAVQPPRRKPVRSLDAAESTRRRRRSHGSGRGGRPERTGH